MPRFQIQLEGSNILLNGDVVGDASATIRGFFVTRVVDASSPNEAVAKAIAVVKAEWADGRFRHYQVTPNLTIADVRTLGFWKGLVARNTGYVFHPDD
jgi:hypothetical protein